MAIKYNEQDKTYSRLNDSGKLLGTVAPNDSLGRYGGIAAEYAAQQEQAAKAKEPSGYDKYKAVAEQYNNALKEAKNQQVEAQVQNMTRQISEARANTEEANAQAYAAKEIAAKNIGQQLAAAGLNSGSASETARLQNELNWQNTVNSNNRQMLTAEENIKNQINQYRAQAAAENAEMDASLAGQLNQVYLEQEQQNKADELAREQWEYQKARDRISDQWTAQQMASQQTENERSLALQLLGKGYNNEQIAGALGLSTAEIAKQLAAAKVGKATSSGGTSVTATSGGKLSQSVATSSGTSSADVESREAAEEKQAKRLALALQLMNAGLTAGAFLQPQNVVKAAGASQMTKEEVAQAFAEGKISEEELAAVCRANGIELK